MGQETIRSDPKCRKNLTNTAPPLPAPAPLPEGTVAPPAAGEGGGE